MARDEKRIHRQLHVALSSIQRQHEGSSLGNTPKGPLANRGASIHIKCHYALEHYLAHDWSTCLRLFCGYDLATGARNDPGLGFHGQSKTQA
ncbi:hypothetical protein E4T56_gene15875 [Termitomyces sp. T112]|nr:hypothetical protein E4T56_gene15875 [Termitomyces sp. T112]